MRNPHREHGLDGRRWSYRPQPLPDETLSSYLARAAEGMGVRPITLLNLVWGTDRSLLNQDLDNFAPDYVVDAIVRATLRTPAAIRAMTLADLEGSLTPTFNARGRQPWVLPTSISNNDRRRHGTQFCSACLRTDADPYFRRNWRLAFATVCTRHCIPLHDACPDCGAVLHPHSGISRVHCSKCGSDLRWAPITSAAPDGLAAFQKELEIALERGWAVLDGRQIYSHHLFAIVRQVAALMVNGRFADALRQTSATELGGDPSPYLKPTARQPVEYLRIDERMRLFDLVRRLMHAWPINFASVCQGAGITRSKANRDMTDPPFAYELVMHDYLVAKPYVSNELEVANAARWLRRTHGKATYSALREICGESRAAIYANMDYERQPAAPSAWRKLRQ